VNDVRPPNISLLTRQVSAGRPTIVARIRDAASGVDPMSLLLMGRNFQVGATSFDAETGIAVFSYPREPRALEPSDGEFMRIFASDFQETKNINTEGTNPMPNSRFRGIRLEVLNRPAVNWITPSAGACLPARTRLQVVASSRSPISSVGFFDGNRRIGRVRKGVSGIYSLNWRPRGKQGPHVLRAVASDISGRESESALPVKICR
jgi:hypothetical protein